MNNIIPRITDKLGSSWMQPNIDNILVDDESAVMDELSFAKLPNYSTTRPSGVYPGKMWKADEFWDQPDTSKWWLLWYGESYKKDGKEFCTIHRRLIVIHDWKALLGVRDIPTPDAGTDGGNF